MAPHCAHLRSGVKMGDFAMVDTMIKDGLWDAFNGYHMGITAENLAEKYQVTREKQDEFAIGSQNKAEAAKNAGRFTNEIEPVTIKGRKGETIVDTDLSFLKEASSSWMDMSDKFDDLHTSYRDDVKGVAEARWSLYPMGGSAVRLPRQIPYTVAAELLLTGRTLLAPEAKELGLIGHVVPDGQALAKAREIADMIAANGPLAVQAILKTMRDSEGKHEEDCWADDAKVGAAVFSSADAKEGPRAFLEKRKPEFQGR